MSFQTFVTERLAAITTALNAISTNAKKIDELPAQSTLNPASKIHVSKGGVSESLTVQKIIDSVKSGTYDKIISIGEITLDGNDAIVPANAEWEIEDVYYSNLAAITIPIPLAETGLTRSNILVANTSNEIVLIQGLETDGIAIRPNIPLNTVLVTEIIVTDLAVAEPMPPIVGDNYVSKIEKANVFLTGSGLIEELTLIDQKATIVFKGSITELKCITYSSMPYNGKRIMLLNLQITPVTIKNATGPGVHFNFPNNQDYILKPNQAIEFSYDLTYYPYAHHMFIGGVSVEISDITGLGEVLDLKLDASSYNQHFKGVYLTEAALNAAHPTASVGDYAQVNEVGAIDVVNYNWDAEENIWVNNGTGGSGAVNTDALPEGSTNLYFTTARVLATLLTGISFVTGGAIVSTDSVLVAFGKLQKQITDLNTTANIKSLLGITTLSGSNTGDQELILPVTETGTSFSLTDAYNGKVVILTASCTVTIPNGLVAGFEVSIITLAGVTLTIALGGSVVLFNNVGTTMAEKLSCTIKNRTLTNNYITAGSL